MTIAHLWCHQRPERSPMIGGVQFFLCWRCTGIAAGALALLMHIALKRKLPTLAVSLIFSLALPLDLIVNSFGFFALANSRRLVTGALWGAYGTSASLYFLRYLISIPGQRGISRLLKSN
ncbi:MAG TPA: DUF2085 domain-containing protein [Pyrinomonadaceae bacterium]|nr:DUF2085 domain-containing protein [Pyrinomonadaceae bacterium]